MSKKIYCILTAILLTAFHIYSQEEQILPKIITYIDSPIVEQRQVLTRDEIEALHISDLPSLFQAAGIQILSYGPYGLEQKPQIRGFTDETVRVIIDGVCVNNPQYGTFDFTTLNPDSIEKIEIVKGGFTEGVSDDGAVAGVIYITTKKQSLGHNFSTDTKLKTFFNTKSFLDTFSQSFNYDGQLSENSFLKTAFKITAAQNQFLFKNFENQVATRNNAQVHDGQSDFKFQHFFGDGNSFSISDIYYAGYKHTPGTETSVTTGIQQDYNNNLSFTLNIPSISNCVKINSILSWISTNRFYSENQTDSKHFVNSVSSTSTVDLYKFKNYKQSAGLILDYTHLNSTDDGIHDIFSGTIKETSAFFINDILSFTIPLSIKFSGSNFAFIPKAGIKLSFTYLDFFLNAYKMTQFPNLDDLYWKSNGFHGNPDLKPENGWGGELTFNIHNIWLPFSFSIFTNYYENKIQWSSLNGTWAPQNISSAFYLGFDFSTEKTLFDIWNLKFNLEYLYNRLLDKNNSLTYGNRIMWTPDLVFSFISTVQTKIINFATELNFCGKKYISNLNSTYTKPYCIVNISSELNLWENVIPYIRFDNLFNSDYEAVPDYPMPGISFQIGAKCKW